MKLDDSMIIVEEHEKMSKEQYMHMYNTIGAAMEVYDELGRGLGEAIYQESMELELKHSDIPFEAQVELSAWYKGELLKKTYYADIVTYNDVVVELKSVEQIKSEHRSQLFNYLRLTHNKCGILINFGGEMCYCERYWYIERIDDYRLIKKENLDQYVSHE